MRSIHFAPALVLLAGCASQSSFVHSDTTLGRVVVYRNGIAYFERTARVDGDELKLSVPADKVDDFLKSLTVVDAKTGEPAPIAYPTSTNGGEERDPKDANLIAMKIRLPGAAPHDLKVSYVTEAPSWKPSYRIVLGKDNKMSVQAWAIVDNTSGEDWQNVQLAVGSSSALSFRFDLRSVRLVSRATLRQDDLFAQAPPLGGATYANDGRNGNASATGQAARIVGNLSDGDLAGGAFSDDAMPPPPPITTPQFAQKKGNALPNSHVRKEEKPKDAQAQRNVQLDNVVSAVRANNGQPIVVHGYADDKDRDKQTASLERANKAREQLIRRGVDPNQVVAIGEGEQVGHAGGVSVLVGGDATGGKNEEDRAKAANQLAANAILAGDPIGASHFESKARMSVPRGSSAMVSILSTETDGEVVYYYDAETPRGNAEYPFRAVRLKNPTDSVLESGPVTVFGDGKFIGEGMADPIPARSDAFIPFALDRQIFVETKDKEDDAISKIISVTRGVFSTEIQHARRATYTLHNRSSDKATVYVRHSVAAGYTLVKPPKDATRLGSSWLYKVTIEPHDKAEVTISEETPIYKTTDLRTSAGLDLVVAYLSQEAADGALKSAVTELLRLNREMANTEQQIATLHDEMAEYRARMDELHAQLVTLKLVKSAGPLITSLEKKLSEVSDKVSKATIDVVALQEKLMVARIKFQDGVAELSLEKKSEPAAPPSKS